MVCFSLRSELASAFGIASRQSTATHLLQNTIRSTRHQRPQNAAAAFSTAPVLAKKKGKVMVDKRISKRGSDVCTTARWEGDTMRESADT